MPVIRFVNEEKTVFAEKGESILSAARRAGILIESPCNAAGTCGKCRVRLTGASPSSYREAGKHALGPEEKGQGYVLACQTTVHDDIEVLLPDSDEVNQSLRILSQGQTFEYEIKPHITKQVVIGAGTQVFGGGALLGEEPGDIFSDLYGIAIDIGTTTLVAELIDLKSGKKLAGESMLNPQTAVAQDVLSRIHFASEGSGVETLYQMFLSAFAGLRDRLSASAGVTPASIYEAVYSGNTAMLHMATGVDPTSLGKYPYTPKLDCGRSISADGLGISPFGTVYLPPVISSFVGADITSGILVSQLEEKAGVTLFIDIGTNGEIVLAKDGRLAATSTAAGPAFEGMNIDCGMRASAGAIELFQIGEDGAYSFETIGNDKAVGICGSGLLDIVGELVRTGVIEKSGRFSRKPKELSAMRIYGALREHDGKNAFFITDNVYLTQKDIRQVQLAKGAIRSGITALLGRLGVAEEDVDEVLIAGSFGYHLRESSLINIGLLSPAFSGRVRFVGNTSQSGSVAFLLNKDFRRRMKALVSSIEKIELSNSPDFEKLYVASLVF
ncbi:MAG TPA: ASKHA domain-containing protein [Anaerovoracaceae bacterium]|nr:ASKHA domain-containing protein [Anaerovoracaceae bacterium]